MNNRTVVHAAALLRERTLAVLRAVGFSSGIVHCEWIACPTWFAWDRPGSVLTVAGSSGEAMELAAKAIDQVRVEVKPAP